MEQFQLDVQIPVLLTPASDDDGTARSIHSDGGNVTACLMLSEPDNYSVLLGMDLLSRYHISMIGGMFYMSI
jgi:hypothetical protein